MELTTGSTTRRAFRLLACCALLALTPACASLDAQAAKAEARYDALLASGDRTSAREAIVEAIEARDDVAGYWMKLGNVEGALRNYDGAYGAFSRVIELEPANLEAKTNLAELSYVVGRLDDAQRHAEEILASQPENLRARLVLGSVQLRRKDYPAVLATADELIAAAPDAEGPYVLKARAQLANGDVAAAVATLDRVAAMPSAGTNTYELMIEIRRGLGDIIGLERGYARLFALNAKNVEYRFGFVEDLMAAGAAEKARDELGKMQTAFAGNDAVQARIIDMWSRIGGSPIPDAELLRRSKAAGAGVRLAYARLALATARPAIAQAILQGLGDGNEVTPDNVSAQILYATAESALGQRQPALARATRVVDFDDSNPHALLLRAGIARSIRDYDQMLRDAQMLTRDSPQLDRGWVLLAQAYKLRGETSLATQTYQRALNTLPESAFILTRFTDYLTAAGDEARALSVAREFTERNPQSPVGWRTRADRCRTAGDTECVKLARRALDQLSVPALSAKPGLGRS